MKAVNLLPPDLRGASQKAAPASGAPAGPAPGGSGPYIVIGALAACVVALAGYVLAGNTVKDREAELARVTAEHASVTAKVAALKPYADFQAIAGQRVATVQAIAAARFDWERSLRDLSHALPQNVMLSELEGTVSSTSGGGSNLRAALGVPAITLKGCTKGQSSVARLMSRLRVVRGVTRVSLANSDKQASQSAGVAVPAGVNQANTNPCGKGSPAVFEMVVFFENSAAAIPGQKAEPGAAAAQGATGPTGAAAGATGAAGTAAAGVGAATTPPTTPGQGGS